MFYEKLINFCFRSFLGIGILSFLFMFALTWCYYLTDINEFKRIAPATAILLSALIASTTIIRNQYNTINLNKEKDKKEEENNTILIHSYLQYFISESSEQMVFFQQMQKMLQVEGEEIDISKYFYDDKMNDNKIIKNLDNLLNPSLHKYSQQSTLDTILTLKSTILNIMHSIQLIKNIYIPNNNKELIIEAFIYHIEEIQNVQKELIKLQKVIYNK